MYHLGVDIYAHNRATRRFAGATVANLTPAQVIACPFCGKETTVSDGRIAEHRERNGFVRCPSSGYAPHVAAHMAASLTPDFKLPSEGSARDLWRDLAEGV